MITLKMYLKMGSVVSYFYLFFYLLLLSFVYFCYVILLYCMPFLDLLAVFIGESNECVCTDVCVKGRPGLHGTQVPRSIPRRSFVRPSWMEEDTVDTADTSDSVFFSKASVCRLCTFVLFILLMVGF